jgi:thymidylate kinase
MKIFSISGLDGSGKSTQIKKLKEHFEKNDKKVFYFHAIQFSIANVLNKRKGAKVQKRTSDITTASWTAIQLRKLALLIDVIRFNVLIRKLQKTHDYILTDRYFYDMIINIAYLQKKDYHPIFFTWIPVPDKRFFLNVHPEYIEMRDEPPAQGHDYLRDKNVIFHRYLPDFDLTTIDGSKYVQVVFDDILSHITQ